MNKKGFTLIELLVVIAIIGLLSAIVMVALSSAKQKGSSAGVRAQVASLRGQAELYYTTTGNRSYGLGGLVPAGACPGTSALFVTGTNSLSAILNGIISDGVPATDTYCITNGTTVLTATAWAVAIIDPGVSGGTSAFCVDNRGGALKSTTVAANTPSAAINVASASCI